MPVPGLAAARPAQLSTAAVEFYLDLGTEVEGQPDVMAASLELIDDINAAGRPVEQDRAAMQHRWVK